MRSFDPHKSSQTLSLLLAQVVRTSDGYQPHLVSPEAGLRKLVHDTIEHVLDPVSTCVRRVHQVLLDVARYVTAGAA